MRRPRHERSPKHERSPSPGPETNPPPHPRGPYGSAPARRAATTASRRVWAPSFRMAERR